MKLLKLGIKMYASWSCPQQGGFIKKIYLNVVLRIVRRKKK
jgi:hypothetical protein